MTVKELITYIEIVKPHVFPDSAILLWLNELEGRIQLDIFLLAPEEVIEYTAEDIDKELLIDLPHTGVYRYWLEAMIDFENNEYNHYQNSMELFNSAWNEFACWFAETQGTEGDGASYGFYLSAYGIAVKHGYTGTEEEWLNSLQGKSGEPFRYEDFTEEQLEELKSGVVQNALGEAKGSAQAAAESAAAAEQERIKAETAAETAKTAAANAGNSVSAAGESAEKAEQAVLDAKEAAEKAEQAALDAIKAADAVKDAANDAEAAKQAAQAAENARVAAVQAAQYAEKAAGNAAQEAIDSVDAEMASYVSAAQAAQRAAEQARDEAQSIAGGNFASTTYVDQKAQTAESNANKYTDQKIAAIPTPDVGEQIGAHNTAVDSHNDIRLLITELTNRLNAFADSEDVDLDQMAELVAYIKDNRELIELITTGKVSVSDIINNLTTNVANKPLSAAQGVALKAMADAAQTAAENAASAAATAQGRADDAYTLAEGKVSKAGDTMTGALTLHGDPTEPLHAVPKKYVDDTLGYVEAELSEVNGAGGEDPGTGGGGGVDYKIGHGLKVIGNTLMVNSVLDFDGDNSLPATASLVQSTVGNIEILLATI